MYAHSNWLQSVTVSTLTHFDSTHIHPFCSTPRFEMHTCFSPNHTILIVHVYTFILYSVGDYHVSTVYSITARIPCPNCQPFTFILQLPHSSVRCNCASHQPELGLLTIPHKHSFYYSIETTISQLSPKHSFYYSNSQHEQSV